MSEEACSYLFCQYVAARTTDTQTELIFKNSKFLGLGRQIGLKFFEAFVVFSAKLSALFWHCECIVHGKEYLVLFPPKNFGFYV